MGTLPGIGFLDKVVKGEIPGLSVDLGSLLHAEHYIKIYRCEWEWIFWLISQLYYFLTKLSPEDNMELFRSQKKCNIFFIWLGLDPGQSLLHFSKICVYCAQKFGLVSKKNEMKNFTRHVILSVYMYGSCLDPCWQKMSWSTHTAWRTSSTRLTWFFLPAHTFLFLRIIIQNASNLNLTWKNAVWRGRAGPRCWWLGWRAGTLRGRSSSTTRPPSSSWAREVGEARGRHRGSTPSWSLRCEIPKPRSHSG